MSPQAAKGGAAAAPAAPPLCALCSEPMSVDDSDLVELECLVKGCGDNAGACYHRDCLETHFRKASGRVKSNASLSQEKLIDRADYNGFRCVNSRHEAWMSTHCDGRLKKSVVLMKRVVKKEPLAPQPAAPRAPAQPKLPSLGAISRGNKHYAPPKVVKAIVPAPPQPAPAPGPPPGAHWVAAGQKRAHAPVAQSAGEAALASAPASLPARAAAGPVASAPEWDAWAARLTSSVSAFEPKGSANLAPPRSFDNPPGGAAETLPRWESTQAAASPPASQPAFEPAYQQPSPSTPEREHTGSPSGNMDPDVIFATLLDMGYDEGDATEVSFTCSTIEAAIQAIETKTDPVFLASLAAMPSRPSLNMQLQAAPPPQDSGWSQIASKAPLAPRLAPQAPPAAPPQPAPPPRRTELDAESVATLRRCGLGGRGDISAVAHAALCAAEPSIAANVLTLLERQLLERGANIANPSNWIMGGIKRLHAIRGEAAAAAAAGDQTALPAAAAGMPPRIRAGLLAALNRLGLTSNSFDPDAMRQLAEVASTHPGHALACLSSLTPPLNNPSSLLVSKLRKHAARAVEEAYAAVEVEAEARAAAEEAEAARRRQQAAMAEAAARQQQQAAAAAAEAAARQLAQAQAQAEAAAAAAAAAAAQAAARRQAEAAAAAEADAAARRQAQAQAESAAHERARALLRGSAPAPAYAPPPPAPATPLPTPAPAEEEEEDEDLAYMLSLLCPGA